MSDIDVFFNPKSIAIIGASESFKFGYGTTSYLLSSDFNTFPVNLTKETILGHKAFKNIKDIPVDIDLAIIIVGNENVLQSVKECVEKGVKGIIIESAGFNETGIEKFVKIQKEIEAIAKNSKVRIIGPNCVGTTNFKNKFTSTETDFETSIAGNIAVIAQSGVLGNIFLDWAAHQKIGISKAVTLGNKVDVDEVDLLDYFENDPDTKVITIYVEGVKRGSELLKTLKNITKPIIILKNGRSDIGTTAMRSHTGSIAGNDKIFDSLFKKFPGLYRVDNFYEMFNIAQAFSTQPLPKGKNIAIITTSGSLGILACDLMDRLGLSLAKLDESTIERMKSAAPTWTSVKNPVDLGPALMGTYQTALKEVLNDANVDALLFIFAVPRIPLQAYNMPVKPMLKQMIDTNKAKKPIILCVFGSRWVVDHFLKDAVSYNLPIMTQISHAIKAFKMMYKYQLSRGK